LGLILLSYGTLSLLVSRTAARNSVRTSFCWAAPCASGRADAPSGIAAPAPSVADARAALLLEPASAYRWADLAEAELNANNIELAKYALRRALAAGPGSPSILFRAARFNLRLEDIPATLAKLTAILRNPDLSEYYSQVFSIYRQMDLPFEQILNEGIPKNEAAATGFLSFWIQGDQMDEAEETWTWLKENSLVDLDAVADYVSFQMKHDKADDAVQIWADYNAKRQPGYRKTDWIFNGNLETEPADCPFDWTLNSNSDVTASVDKGVNYDGSSALKLAFTGPRRSEFRVASQDVILTPGLWTLRAFMRTTHIKAEQGIYFHVVDSQDASRLNVSTNGFEGTEEWSAQEKTFAVSAATHIARVELICPPSREPGAESAANVYVAHIQVIPAH